MRQSPSLSQLWPYLTIRWCLSQIQNLVTAYMKPQRQPSQLIAFLQRQNSSLREDNKSMTDLLQLNRQALKIALAPRQNQQSLPPLVSLLFEENTKLLAKITALRQEIETKSCEALISEQIASASNEHEKYVAGQLKDRLRLLRKEIQSKDKLIAELQKQLSKEMMLDGEGESLVGAVEYTDTNKITEKMFRETQSLRRQIQLQAHQIQKYKEQKQELLKLNLILTKQVNELKAYSLQSTNSQKRDFNNSSSDLSKFLKYQSKIAENSGDESDMEELESSDEEGEEEEDESFEQPQQQEKPVNISSKQKQSEGGKVEKGSKMVLPKLELRKAKEIQTLIIKKINNDEKKKASNSIKDEKWKKLESEIQDLRKRLGNEVIAKIKFERENIFLKKFIAELEQRNHLLLREHHNQNLEKDYEREREQNKQENLETLLDICRDVTLNQKLRSVCKGKELLHQRKDVYSKEV